MLIKSCGNVSNLIFLPFLLASIVIPHFGTLIAHHLKCVKASKNTSFKMLSDACPHLPLRGSQRSKTPANFRPSQLHLIRYREVNTDSERANS